MTAETRGHMLDSGFTEAIGLFEGVRILALAVASSVVTAFLIVFRARTFFADHAAGRKAFDYRLTKQEMLLELLVTKAGVSGQEIMQITQEAHERAQKRSKP